MSEGFDLIVVGGGPGGIEAALRAASAGQKTLLVEKGLLGGACLNAGCIPLKSLLSDAAAFSSARARGFGPPSAREAWVKMQRRKKEVVERLRRALEARIAAAGIELWRGTASFVTPSEIAVAMPDGKRTVCSGKAVLAATGSVPIFPAGLAAGERILDAAGAIALDSLPESVVIGGGGVAGCELATLFSEMGVATTVVEESSRLLPGLDADLGKFAAKTLVAKRVRVLTGMRINGVEEKTAGVEVVAGSTACRAGLFVAALGRRPWLGELGPERAGLEIARHGGLAVDAGLRTSAASVYAAGDVVGAPMLAHAASAEARRVVETLLHGTSAHRQPSVPQCVFTHPEIASIGLCEGECRARGMPVRVLRASNLSNGYAQAIGETAGFVKLTVDRASGRLLGAQIAGACATAVIGEAALAVDVGMMAREFVETMRPHPSMQETFGLAVEFPFR